MKVALHDLFVRDGTFWEEITTLVVRNDPVGTVMKARLRYNMETKQMTGGKLWEIDRIGRLIAFLHDQREPYVLSYEETLDDPTHAILFIDVEPEFISMFTLATPV